jgi:hypothetical protein
MEIVTTFATNIYAFQFDEDADVLERIFDLWADPLYLYEFFTENESDLKNEYTIEEAVKRTRIEAKFFKKKMLECANASPDRLNEFFANLYNNEYKNSEIPRQKAKQKWLRLYALKIEQEERFLYVITGGMIKLTHLMEDREHGKKEKTIINQCRDHLRTIGVYDSETFFEIYF